MTNKQIIKRKFVLRLIYDDHVKTFLTEESINFFLGVYGGCEHELLSVWTYLEFRRCEFWDDGIQMTPEEWVDCCKAIYKEFDKEFG